GRPRSRNPDRHPETGRVHMRWVIRMPTSSSLGSVVTRRVRAEGGLWFSFRPRPSTTIWLRGDDAEQGQAWQRARGIKRASGDVIAYRWHEQNRARKRILGPVSRFKSEAAAWKEVERLRLGPREGLQTVNDLVDHWKKREDRRASSTWDTYQGYIRKWITPAWGSQELPEVKAVDVEEWLGAL